MGRFLVLVISDYDFPCITPLDVSSREMDCVGKQHGVRVGGYPEAGYTICPTWISQLEPIHIVS